MPFEVFQIPSTSPAAATAELNRFLGAHRVVNVEKHFFTDGTDGYWSFCVCWQDQTAPGPQGKRTTTIDYKEVLSQPQFTVYSKLRELRKQLGERDGVPVYTVATNEQLAEMVRQPTTSVTALGKVPGFGKAKVERYGEPLVELLNSQLPVLEAGSDADSSGPK